MCKKELTAAEKKFLCSELKRMRASYPTESSWKRDMSSRYDRSWEFLQSILDSEQEWVKLTDQLSIGLGTTGSRRKRGSRARTSKVQTSLACRRAGGGRKGEFSDIKLAVKQWLNCERGHGHYVDRQDCFLEFVQQLKVRIQKLRALEKRLPDGAKWKVRLAKRAEVFEERLEKFQAKKTYRDSFTRRLIEFMGADVFKPQRMATMTSEEERAKCLTTWAQNDEKIQLAAFGTAKELEAYVSQGEAFQREAPVCVIVL
jgi:hypothetical protein